MKINLNTILLLVSLPLIVSVSSALAHTDITAKEAKELIDTTDDLTIIDVREPHEYNGTGGHIPGALNYPLNSGVLQVRYEELPMDGPILVVCRSEGRSNRAANFLDSKDFSMVYDMQGGMSAWKWETEIDVDPDSKYSGGTGEPNDPYHISTFEDLIVLGESPEDYDKHFIQTADIDLDPNLPGRKVFDKAVIAPDTNDVENWFQGIPFTGVFDGNGHTISHLTITGDLDRYYYVGLFGQVAFDAELKNLGVVDANIIMGGRYIGGLVGGNSGVVTKCSSTGAVSGGSHVGGLVGGNSGSITTSYSTSTVNGVFLLGGLVGESSGSITASYSTGDVIGDENLGGLVGINNGGNITMSYSTGTVVGDDAAVGGLVGQNVSGSISSCFWDMETSGQTTSDGGTGETTAAMQTASTFLEAGWDFVGETENGTEDIWTICEGTNYPRFVWQISVGDFLCPDGITMDDFFFLLEFWLNDNCDSSNDYCQGTDLDQSGTVDEDDLEIFFESWLTEK